MGRVAVGVGEFDEIEFQAARTGNHVRAAVRMSQLAQEVDPGLRAEAHVRAGEQWMMADEPQPAADEFSAAIEDGGLVSAEARVHLARALFGLDRGPEAELLLAGLTAEREDVSPRTCDLLAELFTEQGDLRRAQDWSTVGVERCIQVSAARNRAAAPMSRTPVTPLPIAASVSATSTANSRIQTSASSSP